MIDQCIYEVYKRDNKVLIPDFGAIIYSEFTDEVNFNDLLNFDDGKVVEEIKKQQFLSEQKARKLLKGFIQDIKTTLEEGKMKFLGGIGYLFKDDNGTISVQKTKPSSGMTNIDKLPEEVATAVNVNTDGDASVDDRYETDFSDAEEATVNNSDSSGEAGVDTDYESTTIQKEASSYEVDEAESDDTIDELDDENEFDYEGYSEMNSDTPQKRSTLKIFMLIAISTMLIIAAGYYYFNYYSKGSAQNNQDKHETLANTQTAKKTESADASEKSSSAENKMSTSPDQQSKSTSLEQKPVANTQYTYNSTLDEDKIYSLILGSFKIEGNADDYQQRLQSEGVKVIKFYGGNNFYFVGYDRIKGKSMAVKRLREIREENPTAWIINKELLKL